MFKNRAANTLHGHRSKESLWFLRARVKVKVETVALFASDCFDRTCWKSAKKSLKFVFNHSLEQHKNEIWKNEIWKNEIWKTKFEKRNLKNEIWKNEIWKNEIWKNEIWKNEIWKTKFEKWNLEEWNLEKWNLEKWNLKKWNLEKWNLEKWNLEKWKISQQPLWRSFWLLKISVLCVFFQALIETGFEGFFFSILWTYGRGSSMQKVGPSQH